MVNAQPGRWVAAVDLGDAFGNIPGELFRESIRAQIPGLRPPLAEAWLQDCTNHVAGGGAQPA
eukprot:6428504-Pyramimonas_sp.AAC.1